VEKRRKFVMRVLVACEFSGRVRDAFLARGHDAWSCDLLPTESPGPHIQGDAIDAAYKGGWDLMIGHPPCTYIALCQIWRKYKAGCAWRAGEEEKAIKFFRRLWEAPIERICLENPKSVASTRVFKKSQTIHPWQFGHGEKKTTWLWLKNLPPLRPTDIVEGREAKVHRMPPSKDRSKKRSLTYLGIAMAMAEQWG
jgi:hypothetical protein